MSLAQYATPDRLKARLALHERYGPAVETFHAWLFRQVQAPRTAKVLEVGCGSGHLWTVNARHVPNTWSITLSDRSEGMIAEARANLESVGLRPDMRVHSVTDMPYEDASFDLAFANHMLYHVSDTESAISELRRVLKPGGRLYAATNGANHMRQVHEELAALVRSVPGLEVERPDIALFSLETGKGLLERYFGDVRVFERRDGLVVNEPEPYVRYVLSLVNSPIEELILTSEQAARGFEAWRHALETRFAKAPVQVDRVSGFFEAF